MIVIIGAMALMNAFRNANNNCLINLNMKTWSFLNNPFIAATNHSYRAMKKIASFTINALNVKPADVFLHNCYTVLLPFFNEYNVSFTTWSVSKGYKKGQTANLTTLLYYLSSEKARDWDVTIQAIYKDHTPKYIALFPNHRIPFQHGSQQERIEAVKTLSASIGTDPLLLAIKAEVDDFLDDLNASFTVQKTSVAGAGLDNTELEAKRLNLGVELYSMLGLMMSHFKNNPLLITSYIDLQTIRNHQQIVFKGAVKPDETIDVFTHTFEIDEAILFINKESTTLRVALLSEVASPIGLLFVDVLPNTTATIKAIELGDIATCRYLKVQNRSNTYAGAYTIELL